MIAVMDDGHLRAQGFVFSRPWLSKRSAIRKLLAIVWQRWIWPRQRLIKEVLTRGRWRGELRPGINLDVGTTVIRGAAAGEGRWAWPGMIGSLTA